VLKQRPALMLLHLRVIKASKGVLNCSRMNPGLAGPRGGRGPIRELLGIRGVPVWNSRWMVTVFLRYPVSMHT